MRHLQSNDYVTVIPDKPKQVTDEGIVIGQHAAILENENHRLATVYSAPEKYTVVRNRGGKRIEILTDSPVKAGDRVVISRYGGVGAHTLDDGSEAIIVRMHEILGTLEN